MIKNSKKNKKFFFGLSPMDFWSIKKESENRKLRVRTNFSRAVEKIGLIPRSILRTSDRFRKQLFPGTETLLLQEFRISRYQILVSLKCLLALIFIPLTVHFLTKNLILTPLIEYLWNNNKNDIFLNSTQQEQALSELQDFENEIYFELLVSPNIDDSNVFEITEKGPTGLSLQQKLKQNNSKSFLSPEFNSGSSFLPISSFGGTGEGKGSTVLELNNLQTKPLDQASFLPSSSTLLDKTQEKEGVKESTPMKAARDSEKYKKEFAFTSSLSKESESAETWEKTNSNKFLTNSTERLHPTFPPSSPIKETEGGKVGITLKEEFQEKTVALAIKYNQQSIDSLIRLTSDFITILTLIAVILVMKAEIIILKSFLIETVYSFNDTTKSFLIIFITDLLVGFHSSPGWELFFQSILNRFGLPFTETSILLTVAIVPVFLDTLFKYWIFRYLNKISPTTVATLNAMRE